MQQPRPRRQQGEEICVENTARLFRQRQQADKNVRLRQKAGKLILAMKAGDALDLFSAAAPSGKGKLKRLQALDGRLREHAKPQETHPTFAGLRNGKNLPRAPFLLLAIGEHFAVEGQYAKDDI